MDAVQTAVDPTLKEVASPMSSCSIRILTPDGLQPAPYTAASLDDAVQYEPSDGVYTVANTYNTFQTLKLDAHLDRLEDSARREDIPLKLDRERLREALRQMIVACDFGDVRFRITIPRDRPDHIILSMEPFTPPSAELIEKGVRCITIRQGGRINPAAKRVDWMHRRKTIKAALPEGIYDAFLLAPDGRILEGLGSNFYAILGGELRTAGDGVLPGIAQQIVFEVAPDVLPVRREAVYRDDMPHIDEAFLTSSSRGIIPVVEIDGITIGDGHPGPRTKALQDVYNRWVRAHLEDL